VFSIRIKKKKSKKKCRVDDDENADPNLLAAKGDVTAQTKGIVRKLRKEGNISNGKKTVKGALPQGRQLRNRSYWRNAEETLGKKVLVV